MKTRLLAIAAKVQNDQKITAIELKRLLIFSNAHKENILFVFLKQLAVPISLLLGFLIAVYPQYFEGFIAILPSWTNFSPRLLVGIDYLWNILSEPVEKANIVYHIPNIVLYSFGIVGAKKLFDAIDKHTWLDKILAAQTTLKEKTTDGVVAFLLRPGHSILFTGKGDFIAMQFVLNHQSDETVTIAEVKPRYTDIWNYYDAATSYDDLKLVLTRIADTHTGEYIFFPVKDDQIFLPSSTAYDLSPYKLDILCQNLRKIEKENNWKPKRIIIIGDKTHHSFVRSEDKRAIIRKSEDVISLASISQKYKYVTLIDPTDIVLSKVLEIAHGRRIVFRATTEGIKEYKQRFYKRLEELGYKHKTKRKGILTIGYDLFEDQTEQQTLARKIDDYFPIVLSKSVRDALARNGYKKSEFLYVPDLVLDTLKRTAAQQ